MFSTLVIIFVLKNIKVEKLATLLALYLTFWLKGRALSGSIASESEFKSASEKKY